MKNAVSTIFIGLMLCLASCGMSSALHPKFAPSIEIANLSYGVINNLEISWNGMKPIGGHLPPGGGGSNSFELKQLKDFYGPVHLTWENANGQKFERHFEFTEADMPIEDIKRKNTHPRPYIPERDAVFVRFEFTQEGVEFYTSRTPGAWERAKRAGRMKNQIRKNVR